jgi:hypothetical protein
VHAAPPPPKPPPRPAGGSHCLGFHLCPPYPVFNGVSIALPPSDIWRIFFEGVLVTSHEGAHTSNFLVSVCIQVLGRKIALFWGPLRPTRPAPGWSTPGRGKPRLFFAFAVGRRNPNSSRQMASSLKPKPHFEKAPIGGPGLAQGQQLPAASSQQQHQQEQEAGGGGQGEAEAGTRKRGRGARRRGRRRRRRCSSLRAACGIVH